MGGTNSRATSGARSTSAARRSNWRYQARKGTRCSQVKVEWGTELKYEACGCVAGVEAAAACKEYPDESRRGLRLMDLIDG